MQSSTQIDKIRKTFVQWGDAMQNSKPDLRAPIQRSWLRLRLGKAYYALAQSDIPSMFRQDVPFKTGNTDAQRKFVYRSFQVEVDGQTVSGDMCWIGKNGKRCLRYDFDYNQALEVGSVVTIRMGLSEKDDTAENILDKHGV